MKTFAPPLPHDSPLMKQSLDALMSNHEAVGTGAPADIIQRYKGEDEELFQACYQRPMGRSSGMLH